MIKELEEVRNALELALKFHADVMPNIGRMVLQDYQTMNELPIKAREALATLDSILNQDEAELTRDLAQAIAFCDVYDRKSIKILEGEVAAGMWDSEAKAALRAVGLLGKEKTND
jgi:hypothetical protein